MRIVDTASAARPAGGEDPGQDVVLIRESPSMAVAIEGMGGSGLGNRAVGIVLAGIARKGALIDKLAHATEHDRTSGARLALVRSLERTIEDVHTEIAEAQGPSKMGATLAMVVFTPGYAHVAHVGAVRAYLLRDGRLRALTDDHTLGMVRVRQGLMTPDAYRSSPLRKRLYQALGTGGDVDVDVASVVLADRDVIALCTEGVHGALDDESIASCMATGSAEQAANALVDAVREKGSTERASAAVIRIAADAPPEEIDALARTLASTELFRDLSDSERLLVAPYLDRVDLDNGDELFREGDPGDAFYVILDGRVRVSKGGTPLTEIGPGGGLGELCLAGPRIARSATATAVAGTVALGLTRDRFDEVIRRRPAIGTRLLVRSLDLIGDRLRDLTDRLARVEGLAVGEIRPGDLALRTAIVLAARGEWPPREPTDEQPIAEPPAASAASATGAVTTAAPRTSEGAASPAPAASPPAASPPGRTPLPRRPVASRPAPVAKAPAERPGSEAPRAEAPKVEAPRAEEPKIEAPKIETPKIEAPKIEAPKIEAPKIEAPKIEAPKIEAPKIEALGAEASGSEAPRSERAVLPPVVVPVVVPTSSIGDLQPQPLTPAPEPVFRPIVRPPPRAEPPSPEPSQPAEPAVASPSGERGIPLPVPSSAEMRKKMYHPPGEADDFDVELPTDEGTEID